MTFFAEAIKSLTDQPFTYSIGDPKNETEYLERVKIVKSEDELTNEGLPDWQLVKKKQEQLKSEYDALQYQRDRALAYPSYADQFDTLYHQGIDGWKAEIKKVKDAHPKPSE